MDGRVEKLDELVHREHGGTPTLSFRKPRVDRALPELGDAQVIIGMINRATMFVTLIIGLIAGPAVSL